MYRYAKCANAGDEPINANHEVVEPPPDSPWNLHDTSSQSWRHVGRLWLDASGRFKPSQSLCQRLMVEPPPELDGRHLDRLIGRACDDLADVPGPDRCAADDISIAIAMRPACWPPTPSDSGEFAAFMIAIAMPRRL
jgi:hypothetical protein